MSTTPDSETPKPSRANVAATFASASVAPSAWVPPQIDSPWDPDSRYRPVTAVPVDVSSWAPSPGSDLAIRFDRSH